MRFIRIEKVFFLVLLPSIFAFVNVTQKAEDMKKHIHEIYSINRGFLYELSSFGLSVYLL